MKKFIAIIAVSAFLSGYAFALDFKENDALLAAGKDFKVVKAGLEDMLSAAASGKEKAEVYWRLSRVCLIIGQYEPGKGDRREWFNKGKDYASSGIKEDPSNPDCYMWHSANVGRECQTHSLMEQASAVPVITADLEKILNKLSLSNYSPAWQALAELYYAHPFKSTSSAVNFARKALMTLPKGELRLSSYELLAKILMDRGWDAGKRASEAGKNASGFQKAGNNIDRFALLDGSLGSAYKPVWASKSLGQMSDKEEAAAIIAYAIRLYNSSSVHSSVDNADLKALHALKSKL